MDFSEVNSWITDKRNIANITGLRLVDPTATEVQNAVQDWIFSERLRGNTITITPKQVKVDTDFTATLCQLMWLLQRDHCLVTLFFLVRRHQQR